MRPMCVLLIVAVGLHTPARADPVKWEPDIVRFEQRDAMAKPATSGILFVGSSSIRMWDTERFLPGLGVINRGFGGSQLEDAIHFADRIVLPYEPRTIALYAGDNDIAQGKSPQQVYDDYRKFVEIVHAKLPRTRIVYIAIKPSIARWKLVEPMREANRLIGEHAAKDERLSFADIDAPMLGADGKPRADLLVDDGLHLNDAGYALWSSIVRPLITQPPIGTRRELWITNSYGDDVHVYEVGTWKPLKHFQVGPQPHGISATADGKTVHIAIENFASREGELIWVDPATYTVTHRLTIGPRPNEQECTPDGKWIYIPCEDGTYWIIDGEKKQVAKRIETGGRPHNTTISADGRRMYLSPMGNARHVTIVDIHDDHKVIGKIEFGNAPRPPAIDPDEKRFYQNIDGLIGFQVADIAQRKVVKTVEHNVPAELKATMTRTHGLSVRPDGKEIWSCNVEHHLLHIHELTSGEYKEIATLPMIGRIYWICFTPDAKWGFVSVRSEGKVAVIDCETKKVVTHLEAGNNPKRTQVIDVPR